MQKRRSLYAVALLTSVLACSTVHAQQTADTDKQQAIAALKNMSNYLRTLEHIQLTATSTTDQVMTNGQSIQTGSHTQLTAQKPNRLYAHVTTPTKDRELYFNGKTVTLYGKQTSYYATVPAPASIQSLITVLDNRYGLELPLTDLFTWGTDKSQESKITEATVVGDETIGNKTCTHYAYRQPGIDWQLWIEKGNRPLPCKLVIIGQNDDARPQHSTLYDWRNDSKTADSTYQFTPPPGSKPIELKPVDATQGKQ